MKISLFQTADWEMDECKSGWYHQTWEQSVCCCKFESFANIYSLAD